MFKTLFADPLGRGGRGRGLGSGWGGGTRCGWVGGLDARGAQEVTISLLPYDSDINLLTQRFVVTLVSDSFPAARPLQPSPHGGLGS
jgi:hypothetical protein